jgi:alkylhydroperoxidase family enzyme
MVEIDPAVLATSKEAGCVVCVAMTVFELPAIQ